MSQQKIGGIQLVCNGQDGRSTGYATHSYFRSYSSHNLHFFCEYRMVSEDETKGLLQDLEKHGGRATTEPTFRSICNSRAKFYGKSASATRRKFQLERQRLRKFSKESYLKALAHHNVAPHQNTLNEIEILPPQPEGIPIHCQTQQSTTVATNEEGAPDDEARKETDTTDDIFSVVLEDDEDADEDADVDDDEDADVDEDDDEEEPPAPEINHSRSTATPAAAPCSFFLPPVANRTGRNEKHYTSSPLVPPDFSSSFAERLSMNNSAAPSEEQQEGEFYTPSRQPPSSSMPTRSTASRKNQSPYRSGGGAPPTNFNLTLTNEKFMRDFGGVGTKEDPKKVFLDLQLPESSGGAFEVVEVPKMKKTADGYWAFKGYSIMYCLTSIVEDPDKYKATVPPIGSAGPYFENRLVLIETPSQPAFHQVVDDLFFYGDKFDTKASMETHEVAIANSAQRQTTFWLLIFPEGCDLDNSTFGNGDDLQQDIIGSRTYDEDNSTADNESYIKGATLVWRIADRNERTKLRNGTTGKQQMRNLYGGNHY